MIQSLTHKVRTRRANRQLGGLLAFVAGATNAGGFLAPMLERMKAQRHHGRSGIRAPHPENAAFFAQLVVIKWIGGEHSESPEISPVTGI